MIRLGINAKSALKRENSKYPIAVGMQLQTLLSTLNQRFLRLVPDV